MNSNFQQGRLKKVLVIDDDETDVYIASRILKSSSIAEELESFTCVQKAMNYLRENMKGMPDLIFLGISNATPGGIEFLYEYSDFAKMTGSKSKIALLVNSIGLLGRNVNKGRIHPDVKFIFEKPLTEETLKELYIKD